MPRRSALLWLLTLGATALIPAAHAVEPPTYEVYAVRYATLTGFPVAALVQGADANRKLDIAMTLWVLKGPEGKVILVDAGFYRPRLLKEWPAITAYTRPDLALARLGIKPAQVTDVILSHIHWDHADGADLFPQAQVWIQRDEYTHYTAEAKPPGDPAGAAEIDHVAALVQLRTAGRLHLVDGDRQEILPGVTVYTGGRHTFASQYARVNTRAGFMIIASDNVYLYENMDKHVPIAQTLDPQANLAAQDRMKQLVTDPSRIIPGHDPAVFTRFPRVEDGIVRLD